MTEIRYDRFHRYEEITQILAERAEAFSSRMRLGVLTESPEGRPIHLVTITDPDSGSPESKGAYYLQAGVHAQEGAGTTAALRVIDSLLQDDSFAPLLRQRTLFIVPQVNPDGTELALTGAGAVRSRYSIRPRKNALIPEDLDGDGRILQMRIRHPAGPFREDEEDPRIMGRRAPDGGDGPCYFLFSEGRVHEYDGASPAGIVDGVRQLDLNRNWPINWKPNDNAGDFPFSEPETRAVGRFLLAHPNIYAGVDLHCGNNAIMRPTAGPDSAVDAEDLRRIVETGQRAAEIAGFPLLHEREYKSPWMQPLELPGTSNEWAYYKLGISHYVVELGNGYNSAGITPEEFFAADARTRETVFMRRILAFHDAQGSSLFVPWRSFSHPQLGDVEIGGLLIGQGYYMYPPDMERIAPRIVELVRYHAGLGPKLELHCPESTPLGAEIHRIRVTVCNSGEFDTNVMRGGGTQDMRSPVRVSIAPAESFGAAAFEVLSRNAGYELPDLPGCCRDARVLEWFIRTPGGGDIRITAAHPRGGTSHSTLRLEETR